MPDFLSSAACKGFRPRRLESLRYHSRPNLIARLMRERLVSRFVVSPGGFGKTSLACEYADTVFQFQHVFWVDGSSPCFLRDLDSASMAASLRARDPEISLVIFDDVPCMDPHRVDLFSSAVDDLLAAGCEVMCLLSPAADAYGALQPDRMCLFAADLALSGADRGSEPLRPRMDDPFDPENVKRKIPALFWGGEMGPVHVLDCLMRDDLPDSALACALSMMVVGGGSLPRRPNGAPLCPEDELQLLAEHYVYLGIDLAVRKFCSAPFPLAQIVRVSLPKLERLAQSVGFDDRDELVEHLAQLLALRGETERACHWARVALSATARAGWLIRHGVEYMLAGCVGPLLLLIDACRPMGDGRGMLMRAMRAWCVALSGNHLEASSSAFRLMDRPEGSMSARQASCLCAARFGDEYQRGESIRLLCEVLGVPSLQRALSIPLPLAAQGHLETIRELEDLNWSVLSWIQVAISVDVAQAVPVWLACRDAGASSRVLAWGASWIAAEELPLDDVAPLVRHMNEYVKSVCEEPGSLGVVGASCASALAHLQAKGASQGPFSQAELQLLVADAEASIACQVREYREAREDRSRVQAQRRLNARSFAVDVTAKPFANETDVPLLEVTLFGRLSVSIGGSLVPSARFSRQNSKNLLTLLALNAGRDIPRDQLVAALWPDSEIETARRNFYTVWSQLRRALSLPDGTCPYLLKSQTSYQLSDAHFRCDVTQVRDLCRRFIGRCDAQEWMRTLGEINELCVGDLLPGEHTCVEIARAQVDVRTRVVDSLTIAAMALLDEGEFQSALWFARSAYERERQREDVYEVLMRAQLACNQRSAALSTYFECRRFLAGELGLDPSPQIEELYRKILLE